MLADRVGQYSKTTGLKNFELEANLPLHRGFTEGIGEKNRCYYTCLNEGAGEWEIGTGLVENGQLVRERVISSSSHGAKVDFSRGQKSIFVSLPAEAIQNARVQLSGDTEGKCLSNGEVATKVASIQGIKVHNSDQPKGDGILGIDGHLFATRVQNPVWNDIVDYQRLIGELKHGYCYMDTIEGARICDQRCQMSVIGIASDTFGMAVGLRDDQPQVPIAVAGWVLAHVDQHYEPGTPLTNDAQGRLTKMTLEEKREFPERIVAIFKKPEYDKFFGHEKQVAVDGRCWVKVKS